MSERRTPQEPVALLLAGIGAPVAPALPEQAAPGRPATAAEPPHLDELDARIEALLLVADSPLPLASLAVAVDRPMAVVRQAVDRIRADYDGSHGGRRRGFELREVATGWRLFARAEHDEAIRALGDAESPARLSQAALETLAVIAYRQPVSRGQIAAVRAVSVDSVMRTLQARGLIEEVGRSEETGATLYGTTQELLVALGIRDIEELPPIAPLLAGAEAAHAHAG